MLEILGEILKRAQSDLDQARVGYALIGGLAIEARTVLRFTQVADLTVAIEIDAKAEQLAHVLISHGYQLSTETTIRRRVGWRFSDSFPRPSRPEETPPKPPYWIGSFNRSASSTRWFPKLSRSRC